MIGEPLHRTGSFLFLLGSAILPFAFISSMMTSHVALSSDNYHIVLALEANPQAYLADVQSEVLNGILITASIVPLAIALLKEGQPMRFRNCLPLIVGGVVLILWGRAYIQSSYFYYFDAVNFAHSWSIENIDSCLLSIYTAYRFIGVLWLLAGILLAVFYPMKTLYRSFAGRSTENSPKGLRDH